MQVSRDDAIQNALLAASLVMLHGVVTSPKPNGFNFGLVKDVASVVASIPSVLDTVTSQVDRINEEHFGYGATDAIDACTLKTEPRPDPITLAQYQMFSQVGSGKTVSQVAEILGEPLCYTFAGTERRVVQGNTEQRVLDIRYTTLGVVKDVTLTEAN